MNGNLRKVSPFSPRQPGGFFSSSSMNVMNGMVDWVDNAQDVMQGVVHKPHRLMGPPRRLLRLVGLEVRDTISDQIDAAFLFSLVLFVIAVCVWASSAFLCCSASDVRTRRAKRTAEKAKTDRAVAASKRDRLDRLWTVHNKRYDLASFVSQHPGGIDSISLGQGRNCTELFESYHSLANEKKVRRVLERYYVEDTPVNAEDYDTKFEWMDTPFYNELKKRVRNYFDERKVDHRANTRQWMQLLFFIGASLVALRGFMRGQLISMVFLPFCYWWGPSPCMHDGGGAHMSLFSWQHQHTIGHHVHTNIAGCDPDLYHFSLQADSGQPGFRTSVQCRTLPEKMHDGSARGAWWERGLRLRVPMATVGPSLMWDPMSLSHPDMEHAFLGIVPYNHALPSMQDRGLALHSVGRSLVVWLAIIHPITVCLVTSPSWGLGIARAILFVMLPFAVHGCLFYVFSQVSHVQHECFSVKVKELMQEKGSDKWLHDNPYDKIMIGDALPDGAEVVPCVGGWRPKKKRQQEGREQQQEQEEGSGASKSEEAGCKADGSKAGDGGKASGSGEWAAHQVEHAMDYAVDSTFWLHVSNGLNLQVIHHLFPQVGWGHYTALAPIVAEVCADFGVTYATAPTFWAALASHFRYLSDINGDLYGSVWVPAAPNSCNAPPAALDLLGQLDWEVELPAKSKSE